MAKSVYEFTQVGNERTGVGYFIEFAGTEMASVSWSEGPAERYTERMLQAQGIVATPLTVCGFGCCSVTVDASSEVSPQSVEVVESLTKEEGNGLDDTSGNVSGGSDVGGETGTDIGLPADSSDSQAEVEASVSVPAEPAEVHTGSEPVANVEGTPEVAAEAPKHSRKKKNAV